MFHFLTLAFWGFMVVYTYSGRGRKRGREGGRGSVIMEEDDDNDPSFLPSLFTYHPVTPVTGPPLWAPTINLYIWRQEIITNTSLDILNGSLNEFPSLKPDPDFKHGGIAVSKTLDDGAAVLRAELAEDGKGALE